MPSGKHNYKKCAVGVCSRKKIHIRLKNKKDFVDEILLEIDLERIIQNLGG